MMTPDIYVHLSYILRECKRRTYYKFSLSVYFYVTSFESLHESLFRMVPIKFGSNDFPFYLFYFDSFGTYFLPCSGYRKEE